MSHPPRPLAGPPSPVTPVPVWAAALMIHAGGGALGSLPPELDVPAGPWSMANPTPRGLLRPLSTDRPDATESPYTVDPGHVQIETSLFDYRRDGDVSTYSVAPTNLKLGVHERIDLQLLLEPYVREHGDAGSLRGVGAVGLRAKFNLWGNDGGPTAMALMPFVVFPAGDHDISISEVEFGLIAPLAVELSERLGLGLMAEIDARLDDQNDRRAVFVHTAVLGWDLTDRVGLFAEYIGQIGEGQFSEYAASASTGATLAITPDTQLDFGVVAGLTDAAEDLGLFLGLTFRY